MKLGCIVLIIHIGILFLSLRNIFHPFLIKMYMSIVIQQVNFSITYMNKYFDTNPTKEHELQHVLNFLFSSNFHQKSIKKKKQTTNQTS